MAHIPVFQNPFGFSMMPARVSISTPISIPVPAPLQFVGGFPFPLVAAIQPVIQQVGCVILTKKNMKFDFVLAANAERNAFEMFGGAIHSGTDPRDCMNSLLQNIGLRVSSSTPYHDMTNPADGKLTRVYVLYVETISCKTLTHAVQRNRVISRVFEHFTRFPVSNVIRSPRNLYDDKNVPRTTTMFTLDVLGKIVRDYHRYICN